VLAAEVRGLAGARDVAEVPGGVDFTGPLALLYRATCGCARPAACSVRLGDFDAHDFTRLRRRAAQLPWESFLNGTRPNRCQRLGHSLPPLPHRRVANAARRRRRIA